jgi:hypothetical protein
LKLASAALWKEIGCLASLEGTRRLSLGERQTRNHSA